MKDITISTSKPTPIFDATLLSELDRFVLGWAVSLAVSPLFAGLMTMIVSSR